MYECEFFKNIFLGIYLIRNERATLNQGNFKPGQIFSSLGKQTQI